MPRRRADDGETDDAGRDAGGDPGAVARLRLYRNMA